VHEIFAIKRMLEVFWEATGLHVNYNKTTTTMIRGNFVEEERPSEYKITWVVKSQYFQ
jgi:hypothetical protein